jgi:hypothetical protein
MHPAVLNSRIREVLVVGAAGLAALVISLGIAVAIPNPSYVLVFGAVLGVLGLVVLMCNSRLEVTVALLAIYLGMLDGPLKLGTGGHEAASVVRDILIFAVGLGAVLRLLVKREKVRLPPLSGWVFAFVMLVLVQALNPSTPGILKALGGFRQQLEWVPFFFFGYAIMRSKERFRKFFILLGVIALANGLVATYQTHLSPDQLANWGPGYSTLIHGNASAGKKGGLTGRTYASEGVAHVRPPGLGSDAGFSGGVGVIALPCALALLATGGLRRRWFSVVLCLGAVLGIATGLGRLQVVGAVLGVLSFALLSSSAGRRATRPLLALLGVLILVIPFAALLVSIESPGTFSRYAGIVPTNGAPVKDTKTNELSRLPHQLVSLPFGFGLGSTGAAGGFGGKATANELEGHGVGAETQYNFVANELGAPGLILWVALSLNLILLAMRRLRRIGDIELRIDLAGVFAVIIALFLEGASGPTMTSAAAGPYFWFAAGIAAYWFAGPGRRGYPTLRAGTA